MKKRKPLWIPPPNDLSTVVKLTYHDEVHVVAKTYKNAILLTVGDEAVWMTAKDSDTLSKNLAKLAVRRRELDRERKRRSR